MCGDTSSPNAVVMLARHSIAAGQQVVVSLQRREYEGLSMGRHAWKQKRD